MIFPPSPSLTGHLKEKDLWERENAHGFLYLFCPPFALVQMKAPGSWAVSVCAQRLDFCQPRPWNNSATVERCSCSTWIYLQFPTQRTAGRRPVFNACQNSAEHCKSAASLSHGRVEICWLQSPFFKAGQRLNTKQQWASNTKECK